MTVDHAGYVGRDSAGLPHRLVVVVGRLQNRVIGHEVGGADLRQLGRLVGEIIDAVAVGGVAALGARGIRIVLQEVGYVVLEVARVWTVVSVAAY